MTEKCPPLLVADLAQYICPVSMRWHVREADSTYYDYSLRPEMSSFDPVSQVNQASQ